MVFVRRWFNKYVEVWRLSTQYCDGMEELEIVKCEQCC
jgi:hypothetical protein